MRTTFVFAALSGILALAACDNAAKAPDSASAPVEEVTAPPAPNYASLNGCALSAEGVGSERLFGERRVLESAQGSYAAQLKGETSGETYELSCAVAGGGTELVTMKSPRLGGVNKTDLAGIAPTLANPGIVNVGEEVSIPSTFVMRGIVSEDGFVNDFFAAAIFNVPADGSYCFGITAKFAAKEGKGSTSFAVDGGEWQIWGHATEDGVTFNDTPRIALTRGEHVVYLQKREDVVSKFRINAC